MYKVVFDGMIIDVIDIPNYVRYIPKRGRCYPTDVTSANAIMSSNGETFYHIDGRPSFPNTMNCKTIRLVEIDETEYKELKAQIVEKKNTVYFDEVEPSKEELLERRINKLEKDVKALTEQNRMLSERLESLLRVWANE